MAQGRTYYGVLGVTRDATADVIKAAYQQLVLAVHPDKAGQQSQEEFQLVQQAWQVRDLWINRAAKGACNSRSQCLHVTLLLMCCLAYPLLAIVCRLFVKVEAVLYTIIS